ncbi:MAG: transposase domain-containing protein [Lachnospiraceae bacterium]|nr:transposase domain-containing protein [Lachnospiraceae bacterium]
MGRKNFVLTESDKSAKASAIIYSLAETAKANNLNTYKYFELLLTEMPKHMEDKKN